MSNGKTIIERFDLMVDEKAYHGKLSLDEHEIYSEMSREYKILEEKIYQIKQAVKPYLLNHEGDITIDFEDFGVLKELFYIIFNRKPNCGSE
jgi:hypothetical protein